MPKGIIEWFVDWVKWALNVWNGKCWSKELINKIEIELMSNLSPKRAKEVRRLYWSKERILKDLKKRIERTRVEKLWYKWNRMTVVFPEAPGFEWWKFSYFESDDSVSMEEFESDPRYEKASHSKKECAEFLEMANRYLKALWIDMDKGIDFRKDFFLDHETFTCKCRSDTTDFLKKLTWLDGVYWLERESRKYSPEIWEYNRRGECYFHRIPIDYYRSRAKLFMR